MNLKAHLPIPAVSGVALLWSVNQAINPAHLTNTTTYQTKAPGVTYAPGGCSPPSGITGGLRPFVARCE